MYEDKFEIGQTIRSYDFEGRRDCYAEGEIVAIHKDCTDVPYYCYEIKVTRRVFANEAEENYDDGNVYVPMITTFDYEGRVELIKDKPNSNPFVHSVRVDVENENGDIVPAEGPCTEDFIVSIHKRRRGDIVICDPAGEVAVTFTGHVPYIAMMEFIEYIENRVDRVN